VDCSTSNASTRNCAARNCDYVIIITIIIIIIIIIYLLQLGCHPVAVVILHVNKTRNWLEWKRNLVAHGDAREEK